MAERAGIIRVVAELIAEADRQADIVRNRRQPVELQTVRLRLAAHVLVERQRTIHERQFMIMDVTQTPELTEEPPRFQFQVPGE